MKFLVIGGTGRTGQLVIDEAISKGHEVIALVRNKSALPERKSLSTAQGSPMNSEEITAAISTSSTPIDAVLVTLNARRVTESPFAAPHPDSPPRFMADSVKNIISAMRQAQPQIPKIVVMSSVGTGSSMANVNILVRFMMTHTNMALSRKDHEEVDKELRSAGGGLKFVEVRPWMLTDGDAAEVKVYGDDGKGAGFMPKTSRASVAKFMIEAAETSQYDGKSPVITN